MVGNGFALVVADTSAVHSILVHKSNEDKIMILDSHKLMGASGEAGDRVQFTEYIQKNVALYQFPQRHSFDDRRCREFHQRRACYCLAKNPFPNPYSVNILLAGYDKQTGPSLYYIDYIASLHKVDKGAFGYGSYFSLAMMDRHYRKDMSLEEAIDLADKCIMEIRSRLVIAPPNFVIKIVDQNGARELQRTILDFEKKLWAVEMFLIFETWLSLIQLYARIVLKGPIDEPSSGPIDESSVGPIDDPSVGSLDDPSVASTDESSAGGGGLDDLFSCCCGGLIGGDAELS
nr:proteasome subunit beta type-2-A [Ipomoea batatas]